MGSLQQKIAAAIITRIRRRRQASSARESSSLCPPGAVAPASLREALFSDFKAVAELKDRWGMNSDSLENWDRLWRRNPALPGSEIQRPIGWVLEADGAIVGYLGNISLQCRYGDRALTAVTAHAFVVDTPYRPLAMSLAAAFFRQKSVDLHISTTSIEPVGKMALAFRSATLPQADYDTVLFWVLHPYPFAQMVMKKLDLGSTASRVGSILAALAIGADKVLQRRWPSRSTKTFSVSEISSCDIGDDFQALWEEKLKERPCLLSDRSAATLRWHFEIPGDRGCARVLCCYKNGKLVGYAVVRSDTDQQNGLRKSIIADMVARQDDPAVIRELWIASYECAKRTGSHVLEVQGFPPNIRLASSGWRPYLRKYPACPYYYKAADPLLHKTLSDGAAWYACPLDGDATLIRPSYSSSTPLASPVRSAKDAGFEVLSETPAGEETRVS
jgi:hypothetical protein